MSWLPLRVFSNSLDLVCTRRYCSIALSPLSPFELPNPPQPLQAPELTPLPTVSHSTTILQSTTNNPFLLSTKPPSSASSIPLQPQPPSISRREQVASLSFPP